MKDLNMTTARRTGCQSKESSQQRQLLPRKEEVPDVQEPRRTGAGQDQRQVEDDINNEKLSTRDINNEILHAGDEPHAGANNEKLSTRDITKNELPHAGANNEKLYTRG